MNVDETCLRILKNGSDKEACALLLEFTAKVTESIYNSGAARDQ
jgi:hypothetical protein